MSPKRRMVMGLIFMPAFLLQESILIRSVQLAVIVLLYVLGGGKFRILPNLMLVAGIITAYLIRPAGIVLFNIGGFPVTKGALLPGVSRSLLIIGLIYISRLSVSSRLSFNSAAGNLLGRVFFYFEAITENQNAFPYRYVYRKNGDKKIISYLDDLLLSVEKRGNSKEIIDNRVPESNLYIFLSVILVTALSYVILLYKQIV